MEPTDQLDAPSRRLPESRVRAVAWKHPDVEQISPYVRIGLGGTRSPTGARTAGQESEERSESHLGHRVERPDSIELLRQLTDDIGPRVVGSPAYERAVQWAATKFREVGLTNVRTVETICGRRCARFRRTSHRAGRRSADPAHGKTRRRFGVFAVETMTRIATTSGASPMRPRPEARAVDASCASQLLARKRARAPAPSPPRSAGR